MTSPLLKEKRMTIQSTALKIAGTIQFPHFEKEDQYNGRAVGYSVIIGNLSERAVEAIESTYGPSDFNGNQRVKFKENLDFGQHLKLKSKFPIIPVDVDGNSFEGKTDVIGFGSRCEVILKGDKTGQPRIAKLVITELAERESDDDFDGDAL
jgi:hypothetical protein